MRSVAFAGILFIASAVNAQKLSLTPQVGFENSKTSVNYNDLGSFAPLGGEFSPQVSLRLDYKFKQGFGPYFGASTSRSVVLYNFSDIENGMNLYNATKANMQVRMEAGYQFTTKPILFNKTKPSSNTSTSKTNDSDKSSYGSYSSRSSCSKSYYSQSSRCQSKNSAAKKVATKNKGGWVRLQPSAGVGFIPSPKTDIVTKVEGGQTSYEYRAGAWNTAFTTGMGFEFGRNNKRLLNVSVNYFTGIGSMDRQTITAVSGTKTSFAALESKASGWNMRIGIPFTLVEKSASKNTHQIKTKKTSCSEKIRTEYKSRCRQ
ncbi:MAG TPA: hypothetical protein VFH08_00945 [Chitinophagaceae bacterium]|nr:hypothetical protein [Chitinophagaceae bacterium]